MDSDESPMTLAQRMAYYIIDLEDELGFRFHDAAVVTLDAVGLIEEGKDEHSIKGSLRRFLLLRRDEASAAALCAYDSDPRHFREGL